MKLPVIWLLGASLLLWSCGGHDQQQSTSSVRAPLLTPGYWRAEVTLPGGTLPFQLEVPEAPQAGVFAYVINGMERIPIRHLRQSDAGIVMEFPAFNNRIYGTSSANEFHGELEIIKRHGKIQHMPVSMQRGSRHRFFSEPQDVNADFGGRWQVEFVEDDGTTSTAIAEFTQTDGAVNGTFRTPTGDYRFLAGEVADRTLHLSTFDGAHAFLFTATMDSTGALSGDFWSGTEWHETWSAIRDDDAELPSADALTTVTDTSQPFLVAFPDTDGRMVRSDDERFKGKVLLVALAGSWCPNCHDEAAFLAPLHKKYKDEGLEVLGLMYEHLDDFDEAARQVNLFRDKFDIAYPLLVAGSSDKSRASETLPMLNEVIAYPTMIIIDRNAVVRRIHTGFNGPGTGELYDKFRAEFTHFIESLLAEDMS